MRAPKKVLVPLLAALASAGAFAEGDGLSADAAQVPWARFQGRIAYGINTWRSELAPAESSGLKVAGVSLMGDVFFGGTAKATRDGRATAGFRATGGLFLGGRGSLSAPSASSASYGPFAASEPGVDAGTVPYVGIGYSNFAARGGWSFSADLGIVSLSPGNAVRLGRVVGGSQNLDDVVRDMRLAPLLQLGVSYSF